MKKRPTAPARRSDAGAAAVQVTRTTATFEGPVPPPSLVEAYERILPGSFDRMLTMAEKQADSRHHLERVAIESDAKHQLLAVWFGFVLAFSGLLSGTYLLVIGQSAEGFVMVATVVATLAGAFKLSQGKQGDELAQKRKMF